MSRTPEERGTERRPGAGLLVDRELRAELGRSLRRHADAPPFDPAQVQPASVDLRLGLRIHRIRASFHPGGGPIEDRLAGLSASTLPLTGDGAVLERGRVYLAPLAEELALPADVRARFNPRSSAGRCDLFTRVLSPGHARFDEAPAGYRGPLWIEIAPLSFPVRLSAGDRLSQVRLERGSASLSEVDLRAEYERTPLVYVGTRALPAEDVHFDDEGGLALGLGLGGREPAGWRAASHTSPVEFSREGAHDPLEFWEPVHAPGGRCVLTPGSFYLFASRERIRIPPHLAAEMLPVDVGIGEMRNNYAGFFDNGFGWGGAPHGTPAVLEVRARDVPFLAEDGQVFFRLKFFRTSGTPERLYGEGRAGSSYVGQDLTLARTFRTP